MQKFSITKVSDYTVYDTWLVIEYNYCRVDFTAILPELYMEVADPELPAHKGMLSSLFGSSHHSVVDREELCKLIVNSY